VKTLNRLLLGGGAMIITAAIWKCSAEEIEDCRNATPEEFQAYIERNFRKKNDEPSWNRITDRWEPQSIKVLLPALTVLPPSITWDSVVSGRSETDGKTYRYLIYYTCGHGLEYEGPELIN
jgi:hypothetical protein